MDDESPDRPDRPAAPPRGEEMLRARLEKLRAAAQAAREARGAPPLPDDDPPAPPTPRAASAPVAPATPAAPPDGAEEPAPEFDSYPLRLRTDLAAAPPAPTPSVAPPGGEVPPGPAPRRAVPLSQALSGGPAEPRLGAGAPDAGERRRLDRRSEPAFRDQPPPRVAGGAPPGPRLIAENEGLVARNLGKHYKKRPVLRDVSLAVQRGEAVGLLGPNGAGKTTCFYIMIGLIGADYGEIFLDGQDVTDLPMYRRSRLGIGYLPQEASIFRGLSVEQNIRAILEVVEPDRDERESMLEALLAEFSISHLKRTPAIALSGGERRRLEIARALASRPSFVLLDEPLAGIDPIAVRDIRDLVSHLKDRGIGVLITDHNVRETLDLVDRAYILHDGHVLMEGRPQDIVNDSEVRRVYLGDRFSL